MAQFRYSRIIKLLVVLAAVVVVVYSGVIAAGVVRESFGDPPHQADAIVVFGAAEYAGHPSPVLKARLDHALLLFEENMAPVIITTGGAGLDPVYSEGGVGRDYLAKNGVPDVDLIGETQGSDTAQSARRVATIMRANHMKTALVVSDAFHMFRIKQMMREEGIEAHAAPRPDSLPKTTWRRLLGVGREVLSYWAWKLRIT